MANYRIDWNNGDSDIVKAPEGASDESKAESGRRIMNHWNRFGFKGQLIQIVETAIYDTGNVQSEESE